MNGSSETGGRVNGPEGTNGAGDERSHIDGILRELALGLIPEDEAKVAWAHVRECTECSEDLRAARSLYETGLEDGSAHVAAEKLVAHTERGEPLSGVEQLHLDRCAGCRSDLEILGAAPGIEEIAFGNSPRRWRRPSVHAWGRASLRRWTFGSTVALAAAIFAFLVLVPRGQVDTTGLVEITPVVVHVPRGGADPGTFEGVWLAALGNYSSSRYEAAEGGFRGALALDPEHAESWLLLGSSLLIQGRENEALPAFDSAARFAPTGTIRKEAEWQAILARLARGSLSKREFAELEAHVHAIAADQGLHATDAAELEERIRIR